MQKIWSDQAWDDYLYWVDHDKKALKRVNALIKSIERASSDPNTQGSIGKPEPLKYSKQGLMSVRIDAENRLIYKIENGMLSIVSCRGHYK